MTEQTVRIIDNNVNVTVVNNGLRVSLAPKTTTVTLSRLGIQGAKGDKGDPGGLSPTNFAFGEIPTGLINGINATFQSAYDFVPESLAVYLNGLKQKIVIDYQSIGLRIIVFNFPPLTGESVEINYLKG